VLEIGTAHGGSFLLWARAARRDATLVSVDLPPWELDDPAEPIKKQRLAAVASTGQHVHVIRGNSHDRDIRDRVKQCFGGAAIDFLFIDGDHSFEGVSADFYDYSPLVAAGGIIALHDIHPHSRGWGGEVPAFWRTLRERYRHTELVADRNQDGFGIGIIWV
jgi:predicted O-methyltransferase YrrM